MAKFCGKCGSPLDENGLCSKCDISNSNEKNESKINLKEESQQQNISLTVSKPEEHVKTTRAQKKAEKKDKKKHSKKEKRAAMTFGQKMKRFVLKMIAILLALTILVGSVSCALVYFNIADIPFIEKVMGWFGYEKEQPDETHFANLTGKFTDEKITNSDEAIKAAKNAASQLGLQTATDELSLLKEDTVGELTYYRLQQNYQGIPVYGKTIVVVADKNGEAKGITSNVLDLSINFNQAKNLNETDIKESICDYLKNTYLVDKTNFVADNLIIYSSDSNNEQVLYESDGTFMLCKKYDVSYKTITSFDELTIIANIQTGDVVSCLSNNYTDSVKATGTDTNGNNISFDVSLNNGRYSLFDEVRGIETYNAQKAVLYYYLSYKDPNTGKYYFIDSKDYKIRDNEGNIVSEKLHEFSESEIGQRCEYDDTTYYLSNGNHPSIVQSNNNQWTDLSAITVHNNVELVYDFYKEVLGTEGFALKNGSNREGNLKVFYNNICKDGPYANAERFLLSFNSSYPIDLIGHEYTHVVEGSISGMSYEKESGSIMEGYSDIFGELIEDYWNDKNLNNNCDWKHNNGVRDIINPQKSTENNYAHPSYYNGKNWYTGTEDHSGVHLNSTVISHAAYLMSKGVNEIPALSNEKIAKLWYRTLYLLPQKCNFALLRQHMEITAEMLGYSQEEQECISAAFNKVGIFENEDNGFKYDTHSELKVLDKNNLAYDDYSIVIDGQEFTGLFKWGWAKKDYHKEISVDSTDPYKLNLPKGDYTITIIDNFSGNKTYSKSIKARENQDLKNIEFATAFGFDYSVAANPELQVKDVNESLYDNYTVAITGKNESGTAYNKTVNVDKAEAQALNLEAGKYSFLLTDNADKSKTKSFSVRVRSDAPTSVIQVKTLFGKPYGEFNKSDLPSGVKEFNGHYYYIYNIPEVTTWEQAQEYCRSKNGYLATLTTKEENAFAYSMLSNFNITGAYFGLHDTGYNDWQWVNNEAFSYSNWAYGEPSSYSEPYGMFYEQYVETWNDGDFGNYTSDDRAFICEWGAYEISSEQVSETPTQRTTSGERDVVLCLDMSGSMAGDKLQQTKEASIKFINTVLQEDASIAIVTYDDSARVLSDFSTNAEELISKINEISDGGSTNIEDGLIKSYNLLNYSNAKKQIIVLMSDGEPNEGKVGEELISYADSIKKEGVYIYTLGFFGGYSRQSAAQTLMEKIASEGCHYEVSDADSLVFFFGDIADTINGQQYIYIRIACPVDVKVSHNDETLNSNEENLSTRTSFGSLSFEENTSEYNEDDVDDRVKILRLKADDNYDISIEGTGRGRMNYTIGFMDENGEYSDFRKFTNIKIKKSTVIDTVAAKSKNTILNVDEDGDGKYDLKYKAGANERGEIVDYSYIIYIVIATVGLIIAAAVFLIIKKKTNTRKRNG